MNITNEWKDSDDNDQKVKLEQLITLNKELIVIRDVLKVMSQDQGLLSHIRKYKNL